MKNTAIRRDIYDLDQLRTGQLKRSPRREIFRIAGDPQRIDPDGRSKRHKKLDRPSSIVMPAMVRQDSVSDMACIKLQMPCGTDAEPDISYDVS